MAVTLQPLSTNYGYIPGAISVQMISPGNQDYRAQVSVMPGTAIRVTPELPELKDADDNYIMNYSLSLAYRTWSLTGYNTRFSFRYEDPDNGYRLRVPIYIYARLDAAPVPEGTTGMLVFSPYVYNLLGKVYTDYDGGKFTVNDADRLETQLPDFDPANPDYRNYAPSNVDDNGIYSLNFYYVRIGSINTDGYVDLPNGTLGTDAGLPDTLGELFIRRDRDDVALHHYEFKELQLGNALLSYDADNNALKVSGMPVTTREPYIDEEGNEQYRDVTTYPPTNLYATGGVSAYGIDPNAGGGGGGGTGDGADEVRVQIPQPTDAEAELWVNPTDLRPLVTNVEINTEGHLLVTIEDDPTLKAKYNGEWLTVGAGGGAGSSEGGSNVAWGTATTIHTPLSVDGVTRNLLLSPPTLASGKSYALKSTGWAEIEDKVYTQGNGISISNDTISVKTLTTNSYLSLSSSGLGVDVTELIKRLDEDYVKIIGDTMTGALSITTLGDTTSNLLVGKGGIKIGSYLLQETSEGLRLSKDGGDANFYATGGVSAYGIGTSTAPLAPGVTSLNGNTGALTLKTINGQSILGSGNIVITGGEGSGITYTAGSHIDISASGVISLKNDLKYSDLTVQPTQTELNNILKLKSLILTVNGKNETYDPLASAAKTLNLDDIYVKKSGDTMTGNLEMNNAYVVFKNNLKGLRWTDKSNALHTLVSATYDADSYIMLGDLNVASNIPNVFMRASDRLRVGLTASGTEHYPLVVGYNYENVTGYTVNVRGTNNNDGKLRIGDAILAYDATNKALYAYSATSGSNMNFYATGGVSAYGIFNGTALENLTVANQITTKDIKTDTININTVNLFDSNGVLTTDHSLNMRNNSVLRVNGLIHADGGLTIGGSDTIKKISVTNTGATTATITLTIGDASYTINAYKQ